MNQKNTKKILVIDDDDDSRFLLKHYLKDLDFEVVDAVNGEEGIKKAVGELPDIILIDVMMPVMDGYTATKKIRDVLEEVPIIALTANSMQDDEEKFNQVGCTDFIEKPINLEILTETIYKYVGNE